MSGNPIQLAERDGRGSVSGRSIADGWSTCDRPGSRAHDQNFLTAGDDADVARHRGKGTE